MGWSTLVGGSEGNVVCNASAMVAVSCTMVIFPLRGTIFSVADTEARDPLTLLERVPCLFL